MTWCIFESKQTECQEKSNRHPEQNAIGAQSIRSHGGAWLSQGTAYLLSYGEYGCVSTFDAFDVQARLGSGKVQNMI